MTMLSLSLGHKIGLVDKLLSYDEPKTVNEIAEDADLKERYGFFLYFSMHQFKSLTMTISKRFLLPPIFLDMQLMGSEYGISSVIS